MSMFIKIYKFMQGLFDEEMTAHKAAEIGQAILVARSLRFNEYCRPNEGNERCELQAHLAFCPTSGSM
jgi:hypothetical protein